MALELKELARGKDSKSLMSIGRYDSEFAPGESGELHITFPADSFANVAQAIADKILPVFRNDVVVQSNENTLYIIFKQPNTVGLQGILVGVVAILAVVVLAVKVTEWVLYKIVEVAAAIAGAVGEQLDKATAWFGEHPGSVIMLVTLLAGGALLLASSGENDRSSVVVVNGRED